jgi:hypothetical protein
MVGPFQGKPYSFGALRETFGRFSRAATFAANMRASICATT